MLVNRTAAYVTQIQGVFLNPGVNEVPECLKNDRAFQHELEVGRVQIVAEKSTESDRQQRERITKKAP